MTSIGFIGLGAMGGPMASHLVTDGHDVSAYDIRPAAIDDLADAGAHAAASAAAAATDAEVVFLSLPGPDVVRSVVDDLDGALEPGSVLVDLTTSTPATTTSIADRLAASDVTVLGAPVSGGAAGARAGTLSVIVGGDRAAFDACGPLFEAFASDVFYLGSSPGAGNAAKLLNNYLSFAGYLAACEATVLGVEFGLDFDTLVDVINASTGRNVSTEDKLPNFIATGEDLDFAVGLFEKDLRLLVEFAEDADVPLLLGSTVRQQAGYLRSGLGGAADITEIYDHLEAVMAPTESG